MLSGFRAAFSARFLKNEEGSLTVESVLWIPFFFVFLGLIADVSLIFNGRAQAYRVVHDMNRQVSSGYLDDKDELIAKTLVGLRNIAPNATVDAVITDEAIVTTAHLPASDLDAVGFIARISNIDVVVTTKHLREL